ncbi:MAG: DUF2339 domain-containing protein [Chitinophagaceae bacterium]
MTEEQKKILQLEQELENLSSQLNYYRQQVNQLKEDVSSTGKKNEQEKETFIAPQKNSNWEYPTHKQESSTGVEGFIGLRLLHLIGIVVLVIGISIGVKYAVDKELISPLARILLAYAAGLLLYLLSEKLKKKFNLFSAILFSGAMASLYFTTYAAFVYYSLFPFGAAFTVMVVITIFTAYTAIQYDRQEIAILGMIGAYGIPFLISVNSERADLFFTYIIIINCGIAFLSYKKTWKGMVRLAMLLSWALLLGWAASRYETTMQLQAIIFMSIFYLLFSVASIGFAIFKKQALSFIELQHFLLNNILAFTAALLIFTNSTIDERSIVVTGTASVVFAIQAILARSFLPKEKLLFNYLIAFAILSLVFYVGMKWDGVSVTMIWLAIAIVLFAAGVISKMGWLRLMSIILTGVTLAKLIIVDRNRFTTEQKIISYIAIGVLLLVLSFFYQKFKPTSPDNRNTDKA